MPIISGIPLFVGLLFSGAIHIVWRRRPDAAYARTWSVAFAFAAGGWASEIGTALLVGASPVPGVAASLCWLAASLMFVQGWRQRARRPDRGAALAAIWAGIAVAGGLLSDLTPLRAPLLAGCAPLLAAVGLALGAIAIEPRLRRARVSDWLAAVVLLCFALGNILLDLLWVAGGSAWAMADTVPLGASLVYVALGLVVMLMLSEDLAIALEKVARTDPLTGVWNRRAFNEAAPYLLNRLKRSSRPLLAAVAISDIDAFKGINDRFGHATGDEVLVGFTRLLSEAVGQGDLLARLGGEEFALLATGVSGEALYERVEHLRQTISTRSDADGNLPVITASFGVAEVSLPGMGLRDALERADRALYRAKQLGRNRTVLDQTTEEG